MHSGRNYSLKEALLWTRRDIYYHLLLATIATVLYNWFGCGWMAIPWLPIALIGTAVAFLIGFKNNASYDRTWEARKAWGAIVNDSRSWGIQVKDFVNNKHAAQHLSKNELREEHRQLVHRHLAWLAALRYQLREPRAWEGMSQVHNIEYRDKVFKVQELETPLETELAKLLNPDELAYVLSKKNRATQIIGLQSAHLQKLLDRGLIEDFRHMELSKMLSAFYNHQGVSERIKNFPYPRQFATINLYFVHLFVILVPFGMLREFEELGANFVWLTIPFSALVSWVFTTMERIGDSTENPFEGSANDVPITALSRTIEIDLREMLDETEIPEALKPVNDILM
ncbi:MAG: multidrug transporter [Lewinellaceae bacterium]|nr:multidrug transporter [Lewinellaceae bacterium]